MKDLYVIIDRYGEASLIHAPDRNKAVQVWASETGVDYNLKGNTAVGLFVDGSMNKLTYGHGLGRPVSLQAVTIKECK